MPLRHLRTHLWSGLGRLALAALLPLAQAASAQNVIPDFYKDPGIYPHRDYLSQSVTEHIDPFTGSLQIHAVDLRIPGNGGLDISVTRSYSSAGVDTSNPATYNGTAGVGWTLHFGRVLRMGDAAICTNLGATVANNPVLELPDGSRQILATTGRSSPMLLSTQFWRADCASPGQGLTVYSPSGLRYDMTQLVLTASGTRSLYAWYVRRITDRNGNTLNINYATPTGPEIASITSSDNRSLTFGYADSGRPGSRVTSITSGNATWRYNYTAVTGYLATYQLSSVTRPDGRNWTYAYNGNQGGNAGSFLLRSMGYPQGGTVNYGYGWVYFDTQANPMSRSDVVVQKNTSDGGSWSFRYQPGAAGRYDTTTVHAPSGMITYSHVGPNFSSSGTVWRVGLLMLKSIGSLQTETYNWVPIKISSQNNFRPGAFVLKVDAGAVNAPVLSQKVVVRDGASHTTNYANFDGYGNPGTVSESGPGGGERSTTISYYIDPGRWILRQPQNESYPGQAIQRSFDSNGNLTSLTRNGVSTRYAYDSQGNVGSITFPGNKTHSYRSYSRGIPQSETQPEGITLSRTVDVQGNMSSQTDGNGNTTGYSYDTLNRLTGIRYPAGNPLDIRYDASSKTATRGGLTQVTNYDGFGRTVGINLGGVARTYQVDSLGRITFVSNPNSGSGTSYQYDQLDRETGHSNPDGTRAAIAYGSARVTVTDERNNSWARNYRAYGDPEARVLMSLAPPDARATTSIGRNTRDQITSISQGAFTRSFAYNGNGYLVSATHPETGTTTYGRDDAGNMISRSVGSSGTTTYAYDGQNRLVSVRFPGSTPAITHSYDQASQLTSSVSTVARRSFSYDRNRNLSSETLAVDGYSWTAQYAYDGNDQPSSLTYPKTGSQISYAPNNLGRATQVSGYAGSVAYWPSGQLQQISYLNGTSTSFGQNSRLFPASMGVRGVLNSSGLNSSYAYDGVGNLTGISDSADVSYNRVATYDSLNRLASSSGPWGAGVINYDAVGNLAQASWGSLNRSYSYDGNNRLIGLNTGTQNQAFAYDAYGNINSVAGATYTWDDNPNLLCANCNQSARIDYAYDPARHRVVVNQGGVKTYEFHDSQERLLMTYTPSTQETTEYIYLGSQRIAQKISY
ncbi:MAG: RHS repeat protein [Curvibacter sp.]|nr:RHS repeat protein [Curvibacter sp.]